MPVPAFTQYGLLPAGVHQCTFAEAQACLCSNQHREQVWDGLIQFAQWAVRLPSPDAYLLDGSFVTDKPLPKDIDLVVDVTGCSQADQLNWFAAHAAHHAVAKQQFSVDFYPFVIGLGNDFSAFFQYVRVDEALRRGIPPTVRKGILRVAP